MRIALFGCNGQVGWELRRTLPLLGELLIADRSKVDLSSSYDLKSFLERERPDVLVNAAAYNAVDLAEAESGAAQRINHLAVKEMADYAAKYDSWLIHYSTDYVFDGESRTPYTEADRMNPLNAYGRSKSDGEKAIRNSGCKHLLFRTSWVYSARGKNFAKTILRLATEKTQLSIVADQIGAPTSAELVADVTAFCLLQTLRAPSPQALSGTYHLVASGYTSWHEYAQFVVSEAERLGKKLACETDRIHPISSELYPTAAKRPKNSMLANDKLQTTFKLSLPRWEPSVTRTLTELLKQE